MTNRRVLENQALDIHYGGVHDLFYFILLAFSMILLAFSRILPVISNCAQ